MMPRKLIGFDPETLQALELAKRHRPRTFVDALNQGPEL
jgi:hypothetical protein